MLPRSSRIPEAPKTRHGYYELRPLDVLGRDDLVLIDVRPPEDLTHHFGHIAGVRQRVSATIRAEGLPDVAKDTPVVLVCDNGRETRRLAIALVQDFGFEEVYHLVGGMLRWTAEERPISMAGADADPPTWTPL